MHYLYGNNYENITEVEITVSNFQHNIPQTYIYRNYLESNTFQFHQSNSIYRTEYNQHTLYQNYPNPFKYKTSIAFDLSKREFIELSIFSIHGRKKETLVSKIFSIGHHSVEWDASNMTNGIYFYRLTGDQITESKKMLLLK